MSDRLAELRRQRALVQQHLEWLEREIRAEDATANPTRPSATAPLPSPTSRGPAAGMTTAPPARPLRPDTHPNEDSGITANRAEGGPDVERILEEYRAPPGALHHDVRTGCLLYFAAAFVLFCAVIALLYFTLSRR